MGHALAFVFDDDALAFVFDDDALVFDASCPSCAG
jgi:hypothetical protein